MTLTEDYIDLVIAFANEEADGLVLGENSVFVTVNNYFCAGTEVSFTAEQAGTYTINAADGEQNADLTLITASGDAEWIENLPYEFTLEAGESITFVVATTAIMTLTEDYIDLVVAVAEETLTPAEIVDIAYALAPYAYTTEAYTLTGTVIAVNEAYSTQYSNVTVTFVVDGCEDKPIMVYRLTGTGADVIGVGDVITVTGGFKNYNGTIEFTSVKEDNVTIHGNPTLDSYDTEATVSDAAKVAAEQYALALETTKFDNVVEGLELPLTGATYTDVAIEWKDATGAIIEGGIYNVPQVSETTTFDLTATLTLGEISYTKTLQITVNYIAANAIVKSYTFSDYTAGEQYAENEEHVLDEYITVTTTQAHFTTQLRLYSSSSHDGFAIIKSTKVIDSITLNAGNKADTLNVYGSTDGETWTLIEGVETTSTYADHTVNIANSTYTYLKLDVAGSQQVRVASMSITMQG